MNKPKILFFDIESAGVNALKSDLGFVIIFGYKWLGEKKAHSLTISAEDLAKFNDKPLLTKAAKLIEEADLLVGHFASVFDKRFLNGRLLIHRLPPLPPTKLRDTCMIARSAANYSSNRLKHLAKILGLKNQKLENDWPNAWFQVMRGDAGALKGLAKYCEGDVEALEELYLRLQPYDNACPRLYEDRTVCRACAGPIQYRGTCISKEKVYRRFRCTKCGHWDQELKK